MPDTPNDPTTTAVVTVGGLYFDTLETAGDHDWIRVTLTAGQTYTIDLAGAGSSPLSDPYLRLYDTMGNLIRFDDDGGPGVNSQLTFYANQGGDYYIDAGAYANAYTGGYSVAVNQVAGFASLDTLASQLTDGYWTSSGRASRHFNVSPGGSLTYNISGLTAEGQTLAVRALQAWTEVTGINFVATTGTAQITFDDADSGAYASSTVSGNIISSSVINISTGWLSSYGTTLNSYSFQTYIHEIGHALGLGHQGNYNGSASYPTNALYVNDSWQGSIMSYFDQNQNTAVDASRLYLVSPMMADIIAIQNLYGSPTSVRTGNTVYGTGSNAGDLYDAGLYPGVSYTIYDNGGVDTMNYSSYSDVQFIDLRQERYSNVLGYIGNVGVARGTVIENAVGGSGADTIMGNSANNSLNGGAGADLLVGGWGDDTYYVDVVGDRVVEAWDFGLGGNDTVRASGDYTLGTGQRIENLAADDVFSAYAARLYGNEFNQTIYGNGGNNIIDGRGGADVMYGYWGDDLFFVDNAGDYVGEFANAGTDRVMTSVSYALSSAQYIEVFTTTNSAGTGAINLTGNNLGQTIIGNAGANILTGGGGEDIMRGLGGNDTYYADTSNSDLILENVGEGYDRIYATDTFSIKTGSEVEFLASANASAVWGLRLYGNAFAQTIQGDAGANIINGLAGADAMSGYGGNDLYFVDNGGDVVNEAAGQGSDRVMASVSYALQAGQSIEVLSTTAAGGTGAINLTGNEFGQTLSGNAGANILDGRGGADYIVTGAGADIVVFSTALGSGNVDTVSDYSVASDSIRLSSSVFSALSLGALSSGAFAFASAAAQADDRIIYDSANGALYYDADGAGGVARTRFATLSSGLAMSAAEFTIVA